MAIIHEGVNLAKFKIAQYVEQEVEESKRKYEKEVADRPRWIRVGWWVIAVCAAIFLLFVFVPGIVRTAKEAVRDGLDWFAEWLVEFDIFFGAESDFFLLRIIMDIIRLVVFLIMRMLIASLIHLLASIAKFLTAVLMYCLPVVVAGFALFDILYGEPTAPDLESVRAFAAANLPEDLEIDKVGLEGEGSALAFVNGRLNNYFHIYTNLRVPFDGDYSETDMIIVGPSGVTIVEVKNHKHTIVGDLSDHDLTQKNTTHRKQHTKTFYNPVKQVGTHVYRTANYLRQSCNGVRVNSCVLFVNPECRLMLTDRTGIAGNCPVFKIGDSDLISYIVSGSGCNFSTEEYKRILCRLEKLI